jgi:hypothetical protein
MGFSSHHSPDLARQRAAENAMKRRPRYLWATELIMDFDNAPIVQSRLVASIRLSCAPSAAYSDYPSVHYFSKSLADFQSAAYFAEKDSRNKQPRIRTCLHRLATNPHE